jgi:hypothetical protein
VQELPPGRTRPARCRVDARGPQDLPDGGLRDRHAGFRQFAVDPAVPHGGFSFAGRTMSRVMPGTVGGRPGLRRLLVSYFFAASLRCQARSVAGVTGKISAQLLRGEPDPAGRLVTYPAGVAAQYRILVPEYQWFGILRQVRAGHRDGEAEDPAN